MDAIKALKAVEKHMVSGNEQQRVDALLDTFEYGDAGLYLIIRALNDPSQSVRETAYLLLTENQSERAKQALWDYLPYRHLQPLCTLHFLPKDDAHPHHRDYQNWYLYGGEQPEKIPFVYHCDQTLNYMAFIPERQAVVTYTDQERRVYLWDYRTGKMQNDFSVASWEDGGHVVLSPGGTYLIHNFQWHLSGITLKPEIQDSGCIDHGTGYVILDSEPTALAIKSDFTLIAGDRGASCNTESMYVYQLPTTPKGFSGGPIDQQEIFHRLRGHTSRVTSLLLSPDEALLLSQGCDRHKDSHHLWNAQTWQLLRTYETSHEWFADCLAVLPNGQVLASGERNNTATVWDLQTDEILYVLPGQAPTVLSPDGRVLVCRGQLGGLLVWDLAINQEICTLAEGVNNIEPLLLSCDRQFLVIRVENTVQVWA